MKISIPFFAILVLSFSPGWAADEVYTCKIYPKVKLSDEWTARSMVDDKDPMIQRVLVTTGLSKIEVAVASWEDCYRTAMRMMLDLELKLGAKNCTYGYVLKRGLTGSNYIVKALYYLDWKINDSIIPYMKTYGSVSCLSRARPMDGDVIVYPRE